MRLGALRILRHGLLEQGGRGLVIVPRQRRAALVEQRALCE
jgi:hypothetical protein